VIEPDDPEATSVEETEAETPDAGPVSRFDGWRRRSAIGGIATGVALGLQSVFYPTDNEPVITAEAPGEPPDADERMRVILDPDDPTKSVVIFPDRGETPPTSG
jgi:hypothetical protein